MNVNEGTIDRIIRVAAGLGLGYAAFANPLGLGFIWLAVLGLMGLMLVGTGVAGFCPLYKLFGICTLHAEGGSCSAHAPKKGA